MIVSIGLGLAARPCSLPYSSAPVKRISWRRWALPPTRVRLFAIGASMASKSGRAGGRVAGWLVLAQNCACTPRPVAFAALVMLPVGAPTLQGVMDRRGCCCRGTGNVFILGPAYYGGRRMRVRRAILVATKRQSVLTVSLVIGLRSRIGRNRKMTDASGLQGRARARPARPVHEPGGPGPARAFSRDHDADPQFGARLRPDPVPARFYHRHLYPGRRHRALGRQPQPWHFRRHLGSGDERAKIRSAVGPRRKSETLLRLAAAATNAYCPRLEPISH